MDSLKVVTIKNISEIAVEWIQISHLFVNFCSCMISALFFIVSNKMVFEITSGIHDLL